jgi:hypothetical protein
VHGDVAQAPSGGPAEKPSQVVDVAVDTAVGAQTQEMKGAPTLEKAIGELVEGRILGDAAVADRLADAHQFLADDSAGTDGEMPHLGIPHLPVGQADRSAARLDHRVGIGVPEGIHHGCGGLPDGIVTSLREISPAIEDGENHGGHRRAFARGGAASGKSVDRTGKGGGDRVHPI